MLALSKYGEPMLSFADAGGTRRIILASTFTVRCCASRMTPETHEPPSWCHPKGNQSWSY